MAQARAPVPQRRSTIVTTVRTQAGLSTFQAGLCFFGAVIESAFFVQKAPAGPQSFYGENSS